MSPAPGGRDHVRSYEVGAAGSAPGPDESAYRELINALITSALENECDKISKTEDNAFVSRSAYDVVGRVYERVRRGFNE